MVIAKLKDEAKSEEFRWMLDVLQGNASIEQLVSDLKGSLPKKDVESLYECVSSERLKAIFVTWTASI